MSKNMEQNGGQPSTNLEQAEAAPSADQHATVLRNGASISDTQRVCRDFIWGICLLNEHCKYRHELEFESMRATLKFCHDYQNRTGCLRPDCTYLHTSREEENLFLETGQIPRVLAERYAANTMALPSIPVIQPPTVVQTVDTVPVGPYNIINEYRHLSQPPPPPPPPSSNVPPPPLPPTSIPPPMPGHSVVGQMPGSMMPVNGSIVQLRSQMTMKAVPRVMDQPALTVPSQVNTVIPVQVGAPIQAILAAPPPPPPSIITTTQTTESAYTVPPVQQTTSAIYPVNTSLLQPITLPVMFDPSRPPPPLPGVSQPCSLKRPAPEEEAGPSKARKSDATNDSFCENCIQRELRSELYRQESEKLQQEDDYHRLLQERTQEEINKNKVILRSLLRPEVYRLMDSLLDSDEPALSTSNDLFSSSSSPTYSSGHSTGQRHIIWQLIEYLFKSSNNDHMPSLETVPRRTSPGNDVVASILELIRNGGLATENRVTAVETLNTNGLNRFTNGQIGATSPTGVGTRYGGPLGGLSTLPSISSIPSMPSVPSTSSTRYPVPVTVAPVQHPQQPARPVAPPVAAPAPPSYLPYSTVPPSPPSRPYYQPYPSTSNHIAYTPPVPQAPRPSSSTAPAPVNTQNYNQYMTRMPHNYYPSFQ